jgi:predicted dienelactone hydrolase
MRKLVRVRHGAVAIQGVDPPLDSVQFRLFHPATFTGAEAERQTGMLPPDTDLAPWPVVVILNGINVGPESYQWIAEILASHGFATVTYNHVGEITTGDVGLSPGLDISALTPGEFGTRPSSTVVGPLIKALGRVNSEGDLSGTLDLDRIILGGHSAGGTVALLNANPNWYSGIRASFGYAGHTMPAAVLGHPEGSVLPLPAGIPSLIIGGTEDAVVAASATRYNAADRSKHDPILDTFLHGADAEGSVLAVIRGAQHLTFCDPVNPTTARGFLEPEVAHEATVQRDLVGRLLLGFLGSVFPDRVDAADLPDLAAVLADPLLSTARTR